MTDLVYRLRKRAEIRRQIDTRKSVQEGKPDRIADLLEEAADLIEQAQQVNKEGSPCPEFWDWLPKAYNFEGDGAFTKYNMEVAFLAGKQSVEQAQPEANERSEVEPVAIEWTLDGDKSCGYNNWLGKTPFGRILITWKGWKQHHDACVDEFPGEFNAYGSPDEVKALCEAEFAQRMNTSPPTQQSCLQRPVAEPHKPLTDERVDSLLDGFDSRIETAKANGDSYDEGYLKAMKAMLIDLCAAHGIMSLQDGKGEA
jgi:hypothetical protein